MDAFDLLKSYSAKVRPELSPPAQRLVDVYDQTYGASSPGCCPEALAAVLEEIASCDGDRLWFLASQLRGKA
jgi:hypothetical protein